MRKIVTAVRVATVQIEAICFDLAYRHAPCALILDSAVAAWPAPPLLTVGELLEAHRARFRVLLPPLWRLNRVVPHLTRPASLLEKEKIRRYVGVWRKG